MQPEACRTILIVDGHSQVRVSLRDWINTVFPGYSIQEADSGEAAVSLVCKSVPDVVLVAIRLPGMNGIETTRRIKALAPQVKVAIFTTEDGDQYRSDAATAGANAYILKQKSYKDFIPAMGALLP